MPALSVRGRSAAAPPKRVYGYLPYWENIDLAAFRWDLVSDVVAFSAEIAADGSVSNPHALPAPRSSPLRTRTERGCTSAPRCSTRRVAPRCRRFLANPLAQATALLQLVLLAPDG